MTQSEAALSNRRVFEFFRPKPSPYRLLRVGGYADGAYLVPDDMDGVTDCFSPGVAGAKEFEDELLLKHGIRSHLCDLSSSPDSLATRLIHGHQTFRAQWLGPVSGGNFISLHDWILADAEPTGDLILQMDIEGAEWEVLLETPLDTLSRFRIIVVELHEVASKFLSPTARREVLAPLVDRLDERFYVIHAHPNNCCGQKYVPSLSTTVPNILEVTLLRKDRIETSDSSKRFPPATPHRLDLAKNAPGRPYVELSPKFTPSSHPFRRFFRILAWGVRDFVPHGAVPSLTNFTSVSWIMFRVRSSADGAYRRLKIRRVRKIFSDIIGWS